jgi:hypothetical protein
LKETQQNRADLNPNERLEVGDAATSDGIAVGLPTG